MDRKLLDILCCPVTRIPVRPMNRNELARLNAAIEEGRVTQADGEAVSEPLKEALITENGERIYPVDDGIPVMLEERAITARSLD
ncbi:MAG: Trm112 family protein [Ectothiorhodospiraceae bacterium]|nr:Trm112 family protein [Ectothiorhodospiraceae bacterium]